MSELWYWRSNDRTRGPLVTEELEAIVLSKRLGDGDAVRLDGTDEWLPAEEIRRMFAGSAESPAETAARLLETAAARRVQGGSSPRGRSIEAGAFVAGVLDRLGAIVAHAAEFAGRAVQAAASWLGLRGRIIVTVLAASVAVGFLGWRFIPWGESDLGRLQRLKGIWKMLEAHPGSSATVSPEVSEWLSRTESDLSAKLRDQPISEMRGADRQKGLARREMLFATREMRKPVRDDGSRERIDESLESATNSLLGIPAAGRKTPPTGGGLSTVVILVLVMDLVVVLGVATWWFAGRRRR